MRDWLAAVIDGVPANAVVVRPTIGFEIPKAAGRTLILIVMQDPGVVCPFIGCCFKLWWFVFVPRSEDGSITMSVDGRGWSLLVSARCTVLNSTDKGVVVSLHLGSPPEAVGEASLLDLVTFLRLGAFICGRVKGNR